MPPKPAPKTPSAGKRNAAILFAIVAVAALGYSACRGRQRYLAEHPAPLPDVIAPISKEEHEKMRKGMGLLGATLLQTTPEQQKKLDEIWKTPPRTLEEVNQYQKRTDAVLTEQQLAILKPIRKRVQGQIVDKFLDPVAKRLPPEDFEKFRTEVKNRVDSRINK